MKIGPLFAVVTTICAGVPDVVLAEADGINVQDLLVKCESEDTLDYGICLGVMAGVSMVVGLNCDAIRKGDSADIWAADTTGVTYGAMRQAFENWAKANPDMWNYGGPWGATAAMSKTFPCR